MSNNLKYNRLNKYLETNKCLILILSLVFVSYSCTDNNTGADSDSSLVELVNTAAFGQVLADGDGRVLYIFSRDVAGASNCADGCLNTWPVFHVEDLEVGNGLNAADFAEITRGDGARQTTYKGWPLYYYSATGDGQIEAAGSTQGDGIGNVWFVAKNNYGLMIARDQLTGHDGVDYIDTFAPGTGLTSYFTSASGRTVYIFVNDARDQNNFTAADLSNNAVWPIFHVDIDALPSSMNAADFGEITVHGQQQTTFKGWPLYYFGQDGTDRGSNKGISFPAPGVWPIVNTTTVAAQ